MTEYVINDAGCWVWQEHVDPRHGYGRKWDGERVVGVGQMVDGSVGSASERANASATRRVARRRLNHEQEGHVGQYHERVPAEPFARFLRERVEFHHRRLQGRGPRFLNHDQGALLAVAAEIGWLDNKSSAIRKLYRYRYMVQDCKRRKGDSEPWERYTRPAATFRRDAVEEALHFAGRSITDLYPELADDAPLLPEYWCFECGQRSPFDEDGCVWCSGRREFAQERRKRQLDRAWKMKRAAA